MMGRVLALCWPSLSAIEIVDINSGALAPTRHRCKVKAKRRRPRLK